MTYDALLRSALHRTMKCDRETEATKLLLMETSDLGAARFYASLKEDVPKDVLELFETRLEQYLSHDIPIQHLLGHAWFYGYKFIVTPDVLIPRSETEGLVAQALMVIDDLGDRPIKVLDLGCGSGCIGLSIKKEAPAVEVTLSEISPLAIEVAKRNAEALGVEVTFIQSDLFESITGSYDIIVSNPPYIPDDEVLDPLVLKDPRVALFGGPDGLSFYKRILAGAQEVLDPYGTIMFEHGFDQGQSIQEVARRFFPKASIKTFQDFAGKDRLTMIRLKGEPL